jgi:hypothetical protein
MGPGSTVEACHLLTVSRCRRVSGAGRWAGSGPVLVHAASGSSSLCPPLSTTCWPRSGRALVFARKRSSRFAEELASHPPGAGACESAYRSLRDAARITLRRHPEIDALDVDWDERVEFATTWWCAGCGGIDARQPCLGICVWRPVEWVNPTRYSEERACALAQLDTERRLRRLLRRIAFVTPRVGQWERCWRLLKAQAQATFQTC